MGLFGTSDKASEQVSAIEEHDVGEAGISRNSDGGAMSAPSVVGSGLTIRGTLESLGDVTIDGQVEGDIRARVVVVGEGATVKGSILGDSVRLAGRIDGRIEAMTVSVLKTAQLTGDVIHESLEVEAGAHVDGYCRPYDGKVEVRPVRL